MSLSRAGTIHAERGFRRPRRRGGTPAGRRGAPRAALRSDALSPRPWRWSLAPKRSAQLLGARARHEASQLPKAMPASAAGFTPVKRAGGLGGAPLAPPSSNRRVVRRPEHFDAD